MAGVASGGLCVPCSNIDAPHSLPVYRVHTSSNHQLTWLFARGLTLTSAASRTTKTKFSLSAALDGSVLYDSPPQRSVHAIGA